MNPIITDEFLKGIPKAELHLHFEGCMSPATWYKIAKRNNIPFPYATVEDAKDAFKFTSLLDFLILCDGSIDC